MKKLFLILCAASILFTPGCINLEETYKQVSEVVENDPGKIIAITDAIYTDIRIIVTDPDVKVLISNNTWAILMELERAYLIASDIAKKRIEGDPETAFEKIAFIADSLITLINGFDVPEKYKGHVIALRTSLRILKHRISPEGAACLKY